MVMVIFREVDRYFEDIHVYTDTDKLNSQLSIYSECCYGEPRLHFTSFPLLLKYIFFSKTKGDGFKCEYLSDRLSTIQRYDCWRIFNYQQFIIVYY